MLAAYLSKDFWQLSNSKNGKHLQRQQKFFYIVSFDWKKCVSSGYKDAIATSYFL